MTITRETLELAALAGGVEWNATSGHGWVIKRGVYARWCPHLDDGDAARLAAMLCMTAAWGNVGVIVGDGGWVRVRHRSSSAICHHDGTEPDKLRAWREAVTLCAAAVGEQLRGERDADGVQRVACSGYVRADERPCCGALANGPHKMGCDYKMHEAAAATILTDG